MTALRGSCSASSAPRPSSRISIAASWRVAITASDVFPRNRMAATRPQVTATTTQAAALVVDGSAGHVRGHQIRRELYTGEPEADDAGKRTCHEGLGQPGKILDQDVAVGEKRQQHEFQDRSLADHDAFDLVEDLIRQLRGTLRVFDAVALAHNASSRSMARLMVARGMPRRWPVSAGSVAGPSCVSAPLCAASVGARSGVVALVGPYCPGPTSAHSSGPRIC